jgi:hypothetical protein
MVLKNDHLQISNRRQFSSTQIVAYFEQQKAHNKEVAHEHKKRTYKRFIHGSPGILISITVNLPEQFVQCCIPFQLLILLLQQKNIQRPTPFMFPLPVLESRNLQVQTRDATYNICKLP